MKLTNKIKSAVLVTAAILLPFCGFSQGVPPSGAYAVNVLNTGWATLAANTSTNLGLGWQSVVAVTNTSTTWNSTSNAFVTVTNIVSATNTTFADMPIQLQKDLGVIFTETSSGAGTNLITFGRLLSSTVVDTNNTCTVSIAHTAAGTQMSSTNFPSSYSGGFGGIRILNVSWTSSASTVTNGVADGTFVRYAIKRGAT